MAYGHSAGYDGYGVYGEASATLTANYGVYGHSAGFIGTGVYGLGSHTTGENYGVYGRSDSTNGYGVFAYATATTGTNYALYAHTLNTSSYAGYFYGKVHVTGNLSKGGGSLKIDHPLDPANQYLYHSFVESPDMLNIYNGNVALDDKGEAWVTLPDWFEARPLPVPHGAGSAQRAGAGLSAQRPSRGGAGSRTARRHGRGVSERR
jgi:hypothetical protein